MLLNKEMQDKVVSLLVENGLVDAGLVKKTYNEVAKSGQPILAVMKSKNVATDDCIQHATAVVLNVAYYDLRRIKFDKEMLRKIPQDVAQRSKAIPLGIQNSMLVVGMLDTTNVQRTDYISTLVRMPIRTVMISEAGIDNAMMQYMADLKDVDKVAAGRRGRDALGAKMWRRRLRRIRQFRRLSLRFLIMRQSPRHRIFTSSH